MDNIGGHRSENAYHESHQPVEPGDVSVRVKLFLQDGGQTHESNNYDWHGIEPVDEIVGNCFTNGRRQELHIQKYTVSFGTLVNHSGGWRWSGPDGDFLPV